MTSLISQITNKNNVVLPTNYKSETVHSVSMSEPIKDTIEISEENKKSEDKKKLTKSQKLIGGVIAGTLGLLGAAVLIYRGQSGLFNRLYKEKIILSNFPETLEFVAAKTKEEGIQFAKEVLGIKHVDESFTLDGINYVNEGLVKVIKANNGKCFLPQGLTFQRRESETIAGVVSDVRSECFGWLNINKIFFESDNLDKILKEHYHFKPSPSDAKSATETAEDTVEKIPIFAMSDSLWKLSCSFKNGKALSIPEKHSLYFGLNDIYSEAISLEALIREIVERSKKHGITINKEELFKKDYNELRSIFREHFPKEQIIIEADRFSSIYHEMGHLQDFSINLKKLHLEEIDSKFNPFSKKEKNKRQIDYISNRWGGSTYSGYKELLEKSPETFKKRYPDLYKHLMDEKIQRVASEVSSYAKTSIGEFVAEVYARLIAKLPVSDDVMELYRKYNGPELNK